MRNRHRQLPRKFGADGSVCPRHLRRGLVWVVRRSLQPQTSGGEDGGARPAVQEEGSIVDLVARSTADEGGHYERIQRRQRCHQALYASRCGHRSPSLDYSP